MLAFWALRLGQEFEPPAVGFEEPVSMVSVLEGLEALVMVALAVLEALVRGALMALEESVTEAPVALEVLEGLVWVPVLVPMLDAACRWRASEWRLKDSEWHLKDSVCHFQASACWFLAAEWRFRAEACCLAAAYRLQVAVCPRKE
jgi:hypothetical protein